jgi:hypothetical protein
MVVSFSSTRAKPDTPDNKHPKHLVPESPRT